MYEPQKFRRKDPGLIEAILFDGTQASAQAITDWLESRGRPTSVEWITGVSGTGSAAMPGRAPRLVLNGNAHLDPGGYVALSETDPRPQAFTGNALHGLYEAVPAPGRAVSEEDRVARLNSELEDQGDGQGGDSNPGELPGDEVVDDPEDDGDDSEDQGESVHGGSLPIPDPDPFHSELPDPAAPVGTSFSGTTPTLEDLTDGKEG